MEKIIRLIVRRRWLVATVFALISAVGIYAWNQLALDAYPDIADTTVQVVTQVPGLAAEEIEQQITIPLERALNGIPSLSMMRSKNTFGLSTVILVFEDGTDDYWARQRVTERVGDVDLPYGATPELNPLTSPTGEIYRYVLESDNHDLRELTDLNKWVVIPRLRQIQGVADVSNYVQENSALDREALKRGTSVYLPDRVIPMLPKRLSNGICSLNEGQERLALSCIMTINEKGRVIGHQIAETVIRVDRRMTYTAVNAILTEPEAHPELLEEYHELVPMFRQMQELSALIRSCRKERGAIDFEFPESKVILDAEGTPVEIRPYPSNVATRMIEDFMLMANETVAEEYCTREIPFLYRTHDKPDGDRMEATLTLIREQGIKVEKRSHEITPGEVQKILTSIEGTPEEPLISRLLLRSMARAIYTPECSGHFGLAASYYCHFTSPIRRYPDLQIHRIIKDDLRGRLDKGGRIGKYSSILQHVAEQSSAMEQRAAEAEREAVKLKKAEYMLEHVGEEYNGVISGVTGWGFYVELPNTVEGLVHIMTLKDDYYNFDEENYRLVGERHGRVFRLGEPVRVRVRNAEPANRTIDFTYVEKETETE